MKSVKLQCIALLLILVFTGVMISSGQIPIDECLIARLICTAMENYAQYICNQQPGPVNPDPELCKAARQAALEVCLAAEMICSGGCY